MSKVKTYKPKARSFFAEDMISYTGAESAEQTLG